MDIRVQDYIEDRLQSTADLDVLDTLLDSVRSQHDLLRKQLDDAKRDCDNAKSKEQQASASVRTKAQAFENEQGDIDRRLLIVTQSDSSDEAAQKFESSMAKLHKLDVAAGYVELLKETDALKNECISHLGKSDEGSLTAYGKLEELLTRMQPLQEAAEGAAPHLLNHLEEQVNQGREEIRSSFSDDLDKTLRKMHWPKALEIVPMALQDEWAINFNRLLSLQSQELEHREQRPIAMQGSDEPPVLLPLVVMVQPLEQRFIYHFSGNKPTNRLDKPEYFFSHATDLISNYSDFLQSAVQPLLIQQFRGSDLALTPAYIDAISAFITAMLPMLKRKLSSFAGQVATQPQLLSHLVHEVLSFDTTLQESFSFSPSSPAISWRGLAYYMLETCGHFHTWLSAERDFALARYRSIIEDPKAGELDYDSVSSEATKPTKAAIRVNDLLETITDRYRPLSSFSQKLRFLMDIQIAIFDEFHQHLRSGLEAYLAATSSLGRRVQGISREERDELLGLKGLDRICRIFGSADYLERAMRDWSDDVFFLELWEELQQRARDTGAAAGGSKRISKNLGALQEIQSKTSPAVGESFSSNGEDGISGVDADGALQGALFDETASAYHQLRIRSEALLAETLTHSLRDAMRPYTRVTTWSTLSGGTAAATATASAGGAPSSSTSAAEAVTTSSELDPLLRLLAEQLGFLAKALGRGPLRRLARSLCHSLQSVLWEQVLLRNSFSTPGAAQLAADLAALGARIDGFVGPGQAAAGMRKLGEGVKLLSLPVKGTGRGNRGDDNVEEETAWDIDDDGDDGGEAKEAGTTDNETGLGDGENGVDSQSLGLFEAERLVFMDNESARYALQRLGLHTLSESEARSVLERRVEIAS